MTPARAAALLVSAAALGGCGGAAAPAPVPPGTPGRPAVRLTVTYRPHGRYPQPGQANPTRSWTLRCWPPAGSHPARAEACRELARHAGDLAARGAQCLVIVRGAPSASVQGTIRGRRVSFVSSTCAPAWQTLRALLTGR